MTAMLFSGLSPAEVILSTISATATLALLVKIARRPWRYGENDPQPMRQDDGRPIV